MQFLVESLKKNPAATYADLMAKADQEQLKVFPIMYGRAKALLGLVGGDDRGTGKAARANEERVESHAAQLLRARYELRRVTRDHGIRGIGVALARRPCLR